MPTGTSRRPARSASAPGQRRSGPVRFAVVGLGWIAQSAVLPAFAHVGRHATLAALVSDDATKLRQLGRKYGVKHLCDYAEFGACLKSGEIDAVYLALPNHLHATFAIRAAHAGIHVLCEKPMAVTAEECRLMIDSAMLHGVQLMLAYRLHFEPGNLAAIAAATSGKLGEVRLFDAVFTSPVTDPGNIRVTGDPGSGALYDIGIYCINAARYLFRAEPIEVLATTVPSGRERSPGAEEHCSAVMRFPGDRIAAFTCSFGAASHSSFRLLGTKGNLRAEPAFNHSKAITTTLTVGARVTTRTYPKRDQFAPLLVHFAKCVREGTEPVPDGEHGLADVRIIEALLRSAETGRPVGLPKFPPQSRPEKSLAQHAPPVREPALVRAKAPSPSRRPQRAAGGKPRRG